jgi:hypothetical protein
MSVACAQHRHHTKFASKVLTAFKIVCGIDALPSMGSATEDATRGPFRTHLGTDTTANPTFLLVWGNA